MVTNALIEISTGRVMGENIFVEIKEGEKTPLSWMKLVKVCQKNVREKIFRHW